MIDIFIIFIFILIIVLIYIYKNRFRGFKNIHTLDQAMRHRDKLKNFDDPESRKEFKEMMEKTFGGKLSDEEFKKTIDEIKKSFKSRTK